MAKKYKMKLFNLVSKMELEKSTDLKIEVKHFFSGAALYIGDDICASWSQVGLAFKLPEPDVEKLIARGDAKPLQYFPKGHIKKGYALFKNPTKRPTSEWKPYFDKAVQQVLG